MDLRLGLDGAPRYTRTLETFSDGTIGGASTALYIHNRNETTITKLGSGVYLNELYLARSFTGSAAANDCQSGPSAAFRISAIRDELLGWYKQTVLGHWMVLSPIHLAFILVLTHVSKGYQRRQTHDYASPPQGLASCLCQRRPDSHRDPNNIAKMALATGNITYPILINPPFNGRR